MSDKAKEAGERFLAELLAHVPADRQAEVREALAPTVEVLGAGALRQSDYSRAMDEARQAAERAQAWHQELDAWYAQNAAKLTANPTTTQPTPAANPTLTTGSPIQSPATAVAGMTREEIAAMLAEREQAAVAAIVHTNQLSGKHYATFKEPLDIAKLMADPDMPKMGLLGVYDKHYKAKYDELAKQAEDARIEAEVQKRLAASRSSVMPYPVAGREPSPLDALEQAIANPPDPTKPVTAPAGSQHVIDAAVAAYEAAQLRHYGAPTV